MGKVKSRRRVFHAKAARAGEDKDVDMHNVTPQPQPPQQPPARDSAMFSNVKIDMSQLAGRLPDVDDARSVITSKTFKGMSIPKKEKQKIKKEFLIKKLDAVAGARREEAARRRRRGTPITGDMQGMADTLPTLDLLMRHTKTTHRPEPKHRPIQKVNRRQKDMLSDVNTFQQVLAHPAFRAHPFTTITEHLKNRQIREDQDQGGSGS